MNGKLVALFVVISLASLCYARPSGFDQQGLSAEEILNFLSSKRENAKISYVDEIQVCNARCTHVHLLFMIIMYMHTVCM